MPTTTARIFRAGLWTIVLLALGATLEIALAIWISQSWPPPLIDREGPKLRVEGTEFLLIQSHSLGAQHETILTSLIEPFSIPDKFPNINTYLPLAPSPWTTKYLNRVMHEPIRLPYRIDTYAYGWPCICISCAQWQAVGGFQHYDVIERPIRFIDMRRPTAIPSGIRPVGLAIDAALFALLFAPIPLAIRAFRCRSRRRRNHCPFCNYDLNATPPTQPCPECGHNRAPPTR
jgi:hypothetical protein